MDVLACACACVTQGLERFNGFWGCFGFRRASARTLLRTMMRSIARQPVSVADFAGTYPHTHARTETLGHAHKSKERRRLFVYKGAIQNAFTHAYSSVKLGAVKSVPSLVPVRVSISNCMAMCP